MSNPHTILKALLSVEAEGWPPESELDALVERALSAAVAILGLSKDYPSEVSLLFTDDATIQLLNHEWRAQDKPTNVLSFPAFVLKPGMAPKPLLGDIILALETISREAQEEAKDFEHHLVHLIIHGLLHLLGYDHETDDDATVMEDLEVQILTSLAIPNPYELFDEHHA